MLSRRLFKCVLCALVGVASAEEAFSQNLGLRKAGGNCNIPLSPIASQAGSVVNGTNLAASAGDITASQSGSISASGGSADAEVIVSVTADCNTVLNSINTLGSVNASSQQIAEAYSGNPSADTANGGSAFWGHSPSTPLVTGLFEIQPDPLDPGVTGGTIYGLMDIIAEETVNGGLTDSQFDSIIICGRYYILSLGANGASTTEIGYIDAVMGWPVALVTYTGGSGVNYIVNTVEVRPVWHQIPLQVEQLSLSDARVPPANASTCIVSQSGSSSITVEPIGENDPLPTEAVQIFSGDVLIDDFDIP